MTGGTDEPGQPLSAQRAEVSIVERQGLRTTVVGVGFVAGGVLGFLFGSFSGGAAIGTVAGAVLLALFELIAGRHGSAS